MFVYLVQKGEKCEGGNVYGVYADRQLAQVKVDELIKESFFTFKKSALGCDYWEGGCDWISISKRRVENV